MSDFRTIERLDSITAEEFVHRFSFNLIESILNEKGMSLHSPGDVIMHGRIYWTLVREGLIEPCRPGSDPRPLLGSMLVSVNDLNYRVEDSGDRFWLASFHQNGKDFVIQVVDSNGKERV